MTVIDARKATIPKGKSGSLQSGLGVALVAVKLSLIFPERPAEILQLVQPLEMQQPGVGDASTDGYFLPAFYTFGGFWISSKGGV